MFPKKMLLDPLFSFRKKTLSLRSCRHGRWYLSPRPGEWHPQTKLVSRKMSQNHHKFSGYFLDSAFNGYLVVEKTERKSMVKWSKELFTKKNMNSAQTLTPTGFSERGFGQTSGCGSQFLLFVTWSSKPFVRNPGIPTTMY